MKEIYIQQERLFLHWQKAMWWPKEKTLLVADTHFSKDSVFRQNGIAIPAGSTQQDLQRLSALIEETSTECLVILGDFVHGRMSDNDPFLGEFTRWQKKHGNLSLDIITGNHDRHIDKALFADVQWHRYLDIGPFRLKHEPKKEPDHYVIAGHIHPVIRLTTGRSDRMTLPVFISNANMATLPSFGSLTGGHQIVPKEDDRVFAFGEKDVIRIQ